MWRAFLPLLRVSLAVVAVGSLSGSEVVPPGVQNAATPSASSASLVKVVDEFVASLPSSVVPVIAPKTSEIPAGAEVPSLWKEYRDPRVEISFRYPPSYEESKDKPGNIPGLDCSAKNTICFHRRKEGGKQEFYSVDTLLSLTVSRNVSAFSCLSPPNALPDPPYRTSAANALTNLGGRLWRKSDCGGAAGGTGTACTRYDIFADRACYELIPQVSMGCGGVSGEDHDACGAEATAQEKDLDRVVSTFQFLKPISPVDPRLPLPRQITYLPPMAYSSYTLKDGQVGISFSYPDDLDWNLMDTQYEHRLAGKIALGGAQIGQRPFIAISFDPSIAVFKLQPETGFIQFMKSNRLGQGYGLNGDARLPDMPKGMWKVSGGPGVWGYFLMNYGVMGRVNGTLALSVSVCHSYTCTVAPPQEILIEFLDLNDEIARHFLSSLRITMPGESHTLVAGEKLN